jgi:hypothetical protein
MFLLLLLKTNRVVFQLSSPGTVHLIRKALLPFALYLRQCLRET